MSVFLEEELSPLSCLLFRNSLALTLLPPCAEGSVGVPLVKVRPGDENAAVGAEVAVKFDLLRYHY